MRAGEREDRQTSKQTSSQTTLLWLGVCLLIGTAAFTIGTQRRSSALHTSLFSRRDATDSLEDRVAALEQQLNQLQATKRGEPGLDGERGPRGYRGPPGMDGKQGRTGPMGFSGQDGRDGYCAVFNQTTGQIQVPCPKAIATAADSETVEQLRRTVTGLTRQLQILQVALEQRVRYEGGSGLTQVRGYGGGSQSFHEPAYTNVGFANFHNHADHRYTIGMGEVAAVLNGLEFWTRHNDYKLAQPSSTSTDYHATEPVEQPFVPPEVLARATSCAQPPCVEEQAEEMRRWFHAWQDQDPKCPSCKKLDDEREAQGLPRLDAPDTERHYQDYFRPILCYLEGAWIKTDDDIDEPFESDRHFIDAKTWRELYDKNRFMYQSGRKSLQENLPFLPMSVRETRLNDSVPEFANWEYRIACHRLRHNVPLDRFRVASDLAVQLLGRTGAALTLEELEQSRYARFELNPKNSSSWHEGRIAYQYIDQLMEEIPGKDNYPAKLFDDSFNNNATHYLRQEEVLNTGYYSRFYAVQQKDAMGRASARRGFNDPNLWAAMTTQERVAGITACTAELVSGEGEGSYCNDQTVKSQKWTWAIPIEIIYLTPLTHWNPYNITYCPYSYQHSRCRHVKADQRNGDLTPDKALNGTSENAFFRTPVEFFSDQGDDNVDAADTSSGVVGVLDASGTMRQVRASGHWIHFPAIKGFERKIRQRYPIMPIHEQGHTSWKELKALQAMSIGLPGTLTPDFLNGLEDVVEEREGVKLELDYTTFPGVGGHAHTFHLSKQDLDELKANGQVMAITSQDNGHTHQVTVTRTPLVDSDGRRTYAYSLLQCDSTVGIELNGQIVQYPRVCGADLDTYLRARENTTDWISSLQPYAFYTRPELTFDTENGVWHDSSPNGRHSTEHGVDLPVLVDAPPQIPALRFNKNSGIRLGNGTLPDQFTIVARARYTSKQDYARRILMGEQADVSFGWHYGNIGYTYIHGNRIGDRVDVSAIDAFVVSATRNTATTPTSWVNGQDNSRQGSGPLGGTQRLTINGRANYAYQYSDAEVSDVVVFDRHLSTNDVEKVVAALMNQPDKPKRCCWDGHAGVHPITS